MSLIERYIDTLWIEIGLPALAVGFLAGALLAWLFGTPQDTADRDTRQDPGGAGTRT